MTMEFATFTAAQVEEHRTSRSVWVTLRGKVYDVTDFIADHPGGADSILQHGGIDIEEIMGDENTHAHSKAAYKMLEGYYIGTLVNGEEEKDKDAATAKTAVALGFGRKSSDFIDPTRPMLAQVWGAQFTKEFYVEQVHLPRQVKGSAPLFGPWYLEMFSLTPWWIIPLVYIPITIYNIHHAVTELGASLHTVPAFFAVGILVWTFVEYSLHRFLFHIDEFLPDNQVAFTLHFLLHGIHHFLPMDKMRLVMPPALGLVLSIPVYKVVIALFPVGSGNIVAGGAYCGFMLYDLIHYHLHHARPYTAYLREMKTYHLDHHYKNAHLGFGITNKLWDYVFNTELK
ncbi:hypothetical protein CcCBS67573_g03729 [Chytriomyces confervae]|uniref:Ceramide very long chain fatty acid hydroxylase n=1 Tax=Chytriomyces confervae TaxID=246404 RepID=A0A507FHZ6_9FUNG|nr:fatty acid alpha-hydroxylase [Chytriomyces hyalinus]TPX74998.1 hypothetical protein CcCBS67573_g03729 [Chytriomyces confervae]